jgi:hypothetical protein
VLRLLPLLTALLLVTACGPAPFEVNLQLVFGELQTPLVGAAHIQVDAVYPEGEPVSGDLNANSGQYIVEGLRPGLGVVFDVHFTDSSDRILALGRSQPVDIDAEGADLAVFVGEADSLVRIPDGLAVPRTYASLAAAPSGRVVVTGGGDNVDAAVREVEFIGWTVDDPVHGSVGMDLRRIGHQSLYVPAEAGGPWAGKVAVIGGTTTAGGDTLVGGESGGVASVATVDPVTGQAEAAVTDLAAGYMGFRAAFVQDGRIALVGGFDDTGEYNRVLRLLDPATGGEVPAYQAVAQEQHTITTFSVAGNERVLIAGGVDHVGGLGDLLLWTGLEEDAPDPQDGLQLNEPRARHQATSLGNGQVLITGGAGDLTDPTDQGRSLDSAEIFDPQYHSVTLLNEPMLAPRQRHVAVAIPHDRILICAGEDTQGTPLSSCETYDIDTGFFDIFTSGSMSPGGPGIASTPLGDGRIIFAGGLADDGGPGRSIWIYTPPSFL